MSAKTYHSMIAGSRFEFATGRVVYFVGEKGQNGSYSTDDKDEIKELDKISSNPGSGISVGDTPTAKEATSGIAAEILKKAAEARAGETKAVANGQGGGTVVGG